jgi:hypothetical protein
MTETVKLNRMRPELSAAGGRWRQEEKTEKALESAGWPVLRIKHSRRHLASAAPIRAGAQSGGPYTKLNSTPIAPTNETDSTVQSGQNYFYVVTAVDSSNVESAYSNEVSAVIPIP